MTKKGIVALADTIIRVQQDSSVPCFTEYQIEQLAAFCQRQNPNFNYRLWYDYIAGKVGKNGGKR